MAAQTVSQYTKLEKEKNTEHYTPANVDHN